MQYENLNNIIPSIGYFNHRNNASTWEIENSVIDFIDLTYVTKGEAIYTIDKKQMKVKAGDLLCIPSGSERYAKSAAPEGFECFATNFLLDDMTSGREVALPLPLIAQLGIHGDVISHYMRLKQTWQEQPVGYVMCARAHFLLILQRVLSILVFEAGAQNIDLRVKNAMRLIREKYSEQITIVNIADAIGLNPVYFGTLFKRETRVTFKDYLNTVRVNQAEEMLRTGKYSVTEVSASCGFLDVFYFSRLFKKHKGVPPSAVYSKGVIY